jgi:hypothetical protein
MTPPDGLRSRRAAPHSAALADHFMTCQRYKLILPSTRSAALKTAHRMNVAKVK